MGAEDETNCGSRPPCIWGHQALSPQLLFYTKYLPGCLLRPTQHSILMLDSKLLPCREGCGRVGQCDSIESRACSSRF